MHVNETLNYFVTFKKSRAYYAHDRHQRVQYNYFIYDNFDAAIMTF